MEFKFSVLFDESYLKCSFNKQIWLLAVIFSIAVADHAFVPSRFTDSVSFAIINHQVLS